MLLTGSGRNSEISSGANTSPLAEKCRSIAVSIVPLLRSPSVPPAALLSVSIASEALSAGARWSL